MEIAIAVFNALLALGGKLAKWIGDWKEADAKTRAELVADAMAAYAKLGELMTDLVARFVANNAKVDDAIKTKYPPREDDKPDSTLPPGKVAAIVAGKDDGGPSER